MLNLYSGEYCVDKIEEAVEGRVLFLDDMKQGLELSCFVLQIHHSCTGCSVVQVISEFTHQNSINVYLICISIFFYIFFMFITFLELLHLKMTLNLKNTLTLWLNNLLWIHFWVFLMRSRYTAKKGKSKLPVNLYGLIFDGVQKSICKKFQNFYFQ